jgi:hypothetical protein
MTDYDSAIRLMARVRTSGCCIKVHFQVEPEGIYSVYDGAAKSYVSSE